MALFVAASCGIVLLLRPFVLRSAVEGAQWDRVLGYIVGTFGVFFGILLGLVAVSVYNDYTDAHSAALQETSELSSLYRTAGGLPQPLGTELQSELKKYARTVIDGDWPQQEHDQLPTASLENVDRIQRTIDGFDPTTLKQQVQYGQVLSTFDAFIQARRVRTDATTVELPGLFWAVIWAGAIINAVLIGCIEVRNLRQHLLMAALLALFIALVMYVTADMDHPYAGSISVDSGDFVRLLQQWDGSG